ncbi:MAG: MFS transporter [Burkholderiales bacterium]|nr:MFS transporter [Burkholderiales bacterium]
MGTQAASTRARLGSVLHVWMPEDRAFWVREGKAIARLNLWISIPALLLEHAVWMVWSVLVVSLPGIGFKFSTNQLFWLAALPGLSGGALRVFYSFMVPVFGGRKWTAISTITLLVPALAIGFALQDPNTTYPMFMLLALLCGLGGANFASSMANISFFFPPERKGSALGLNAGFGNLGVSLAQLAVPLAVTAGIFGALGGEPQIRAADGSRLWLQNAGFIWVPFIVASAVAAWYGMNDIAGARASFPEQAVIFRRKHNWLMCWLYLGTFGSFIGYSAAFPLLAGSQFAQVDALSFAFLGPLAGALARPFGGWLADRLGGAPVTFWAFAVMAFAAAGALYFLPKEAGPLALPWGPVQGDFDGFLAMFALLFLAAGIGNGSTFRMIPVIFLTERVREAQDRSTEAREQAVREAGKEAAAVLGFASAIGAFGGFFIPKSFGTSISVTGGPEGALYCFIVFYLTCIAATWRCYTRKRAQMRC